jgi:hypothetical protein
MSTTVKGLGLARDEGAGTQRVTLALSQFAFEALPSSGIDAGAPARIEAALRRYLEDKDASRPAWPYPGFLLGSETQRDVSIELEVATDLWRTFGEEAAKQGVSVEQLAEHAAFYLAAEIEAGRGTPQIFDDLG